MSQERFTEDFARGTIWFDDDGNEISFEEKLKQHAAKESAAQRQDSPSFFALATDRRGEPQAQRNFPWRQS